MYECINFNWIEIGAKAKNKINWKSVDIQSLIKKIALTLDILTAAPQINWNSKKDPQISENGDLEKSHLGWGLKKPQDPSSETMMQIFFDSVLPPIGDAKEIMHWRFEIQAFLNFLYLCKFAIKQIASSEESLNKYFD